MAYQKACYPTIGSAALKPELIATPKPAPKPHKALRKAVKKESALDHLLFKVKVIGTILFVALSMFMLINRMTSIYTLQASFNNITAEQRVLTKENEDLRAKMIAASSIKVISERAQTLELVASANVTPIKVDFSRENFSKDVEPVVDGNWLLSLIEKAKSLLS